jgi:hypothetical protein
MVGNQPISQVALNNWDLLVMHVILMDVRPGPVRIGDRSPMALGDSFWTIPSPGG